MATKTKEQLKQDFSNNQIATGEKFADLIDSLKAVQSAVSDPAASGTSVTFIATISQDTEGRITVTKKTVNFSGYQTVQAMQNYQNGDLQQVGDVTVGAGQTQDVNHKMKHYPTVRLLDANDTEVDPTQYMVKHVDNENLTIELGGSLEGTYRYVLD